MTPDGRRCCERYDALIEKMPVYEAAVEALQGLLESGDARDGMMGQWVKALDAAREALRRLQERTA